MRLSSSKDPPLYPLSFGCKTGATGMLEKILDLPARSRFGEGRAATLAAPPTAGVH